MDTFTDHVRRCITCQQNLWSSKVVENFCAVFHFYLALSVLSMCFLGLTAFTAALIYTLHNGEILQSTRERTLGHFGYCFILAWVCVPLLLLSGVIYIHLRKKE